MTDEPPCPPEKDLPPAFWLGLPAVSLLIVWLTPLLGWERWHALMMTEQGFIENATVAFLLPSVVLAVILFLRRRLLPRGLGWIILLIGLAALFLAGEETSWASSGSSTGPPRSWPPSTSRASSMSITFPAPSATS